MNYNSVNFNKEFYKGKKFEVFEKNEAHHGFSKEQMKECFDLLQKDEKAATEKEQVVEKESK